VPTTWRLRGESIDDEVRDPPLHVHLEQQGHSRGVGEVWVWPDNHATTDGLCPGIKKKERKKKKKKKKKEKNKSRKEESKETCSHLEKVGSLLSL